MTSRANTSFTFSVLFSFLPFEISSNFYSSIISDFFSHFSTFDNFWLKKVAIFWIAIFMFFNRKKCKFQNKIVQLTYLWFSFMNSFQAISRTFKYALIAKYLTNCTNCWILIALQIPFQCVLGQQKKAKILDKLSFFLFAHRCLNRIYSPLSPFDKQHDSSMLLNN